MAAMVPDKGGPSSGAGPDDEASRAALLQTALELLQSNNDNKKFAGLLLVTKVAPATDVELLSRIYKAVAPSFLQRLLLPLREGSKPVANAGEMVSFGISIWAKLVDLPEVARSEEAKSLIPLLLKVVRNGGVSQALGDMQQEEERDSQAVAGEALYCILAAVQADAAAGALALESGALRAATDVLKQAMPRKKHQDHLILPAAQLLGALLQIQPERVFVENEAILSQVVPLLARVLYVHDPQDKKQISLQLVSLRTLWELLDLSELTRSHAFRQQLLASTSDWSACLRQGLQQILQAKAGPAQRMMALQLTSAALRLLGSRWVVEGGPDFLQVAAVVARVETGVLLLDALAASEEIRVPDTSFPVAAMVKDNGEQSVAITDNDDTEHMDSTRPGETQAKVDAVQVPTEMPWKAGPSQSARSRAMALLPICFEVLEGSIEALAEAEDPSVESITPLSPGAALSILKTIEEAVEAVLQFLEQVVSAKSRSDDHPVAIASIRLLGRFLAECPGAFGPRVRAILPFLLSCGSVEGAVGSPSTSAQDQIGQGTVFLLPLLVQLTEKPQAYEDSVVPPQGRQAWLGALARPAALLPLLAYTRYCTLDALRAVTDEAMHHADIALVHSCQVLSVVLRESLSSGSSSSVAESREEECTQIEFGLLAGMYALLKERGPDSLGDLATLSVSTCAAWLMQLIQDQQLTPQQALRVVAPGLLALKADDSMAEMYCHALGGLLDGSRPAFCKAARQSAAIAAFLDAHAHPDSAFDPGTREHALVVRLQQIFASD